MIQRLLNAYSRALSRQFRDERLEPVFRQVPEQSPLPHEGIRLCALQLEAKAYRSGLQWLRELDGILREASEKGADLVALPELYGMIPLFCHPLVRPALKLLPKGGESGEGTLDLYPLLAPFAPVFGRYEAILCRLAEKYKLQIFAGTAFIPEDGKVFNRGSLISPEGKVLARQDKLHLTREEMALGLSAGDILRVVPTKAGNIALSVCMDATYFETFRIAKKLGADYIIVPIGDMCPFDHWLALRGVQTRVSETGLPAVKPALVSGKDFPFLFTGKAGIWFPRWLPYESRETDRPEGTGMVITEVSLPELRRPRDSGPFLRENPGFARNHSDALIHYKEGERSI